ncbi:MAG: hypothetical protein ABIY39_10770 [Sphingomonas sp.]
MTDEITEKPARKPSLRMTLAAIALLGAGGAVGATAARMAGPSIEVAPLNPVPIASLKTGQGLVTVRGKVGEVYGANFILADASGRTMIEGGPRSDGLVTAGSSVTVQGWNRNGVLRASFLVGADGTVTALGPMGHGHGGRHGGPNGPGREGPGRDGPDRDGPDAPPPPAAAAPPVPVPVGNSAG